MPHETKTISDDEEAELLETANERWEECDNFYSDQYDEHEKDWLFVHGVGQWDTGAMDTRSRQGRPILVLNQTLPYIHQIVNDIKQARMAIRVVPIDSNADIEIADIRAGIIRNIEKQSKATDVYGTAAMNAVGAGLGWIRVTTDYTDTISFDQEAKIERVLDFNSVYLDVKSISIDGSDADYGFVRLNYTIDRFNELYPDHAPVSFSGETEEDQVCLVEYYYKEITIEKLHQIKLSSGEFQYAMAADLKRFDDQGLVYTDVMSRDVELVDVYHCILSGEEILSREIFPSTFIPLVPVIGEEVWMNGKRETHSLIRQGKDAQRMYNYWKSYSTEMIALQPKTPWVGPVGSFESYPDDWMTANTENLATLEYDVVIDENTGMPLPPPQRAMPIQGSPAMMQEAVAARDDIRLALGIPQSNMGERSNAVSGIAIRNQQIEGDNNTFHFIDNLTSSISQVGRILNDIIPVLYSEKKIARIIGDDGEEDNVMINTPFIKGEDGEMRPIRPNTDDVPDGVYDLNVGKYDIDMDVGASYSSKRQETADKLIEIYKARPDLMEITGDILFQALDLPFAKEISDRIKAQMDPDILGDDPMAKKLQAAEQAIQQMEERLNNALTALDQKEKDTKFDQSIKAEEAQLDRSKFRVDAEKTKADIDKIYADIAQTSADQSQDNITAILSQVDAVMTPRMNGLETAVNRILDDIEEQELVTTSPESNEVVMSNEDANE